MSKNSDNENRLIFLSLSAQHALKNYFINEYKINGIQITPAHTGILFLLLEGPKSMNDLGRLLNIKNSTVTGLIDRLETKNFVERTPDPDDRRRWNIRITRVGKNELKKTKPIIKRINDDIAAGFTQNEIRSFTKVLRSIIKKF